MRMQMGAVAVCAVMCAAVMQGQAAAGNASPAHMAKVDEVLRLTKTNAAVQDQLENLRGRIQEMATQQSAMAAKTPEQKALADKYVKQVLAINENEVGWTKLRPEMTRLYADSFTDAEMDGIIAFYKTPAGQALLDKTPEIGNKTMTLVQDHIRDMQPKLESATSDFIAQLEKTKPATTPSGSGTKLPPKPPAANPPRLPIK